MRRFSPPTGGSPLRPDIARVLSWCELAAPNADAQEQQVERPLQGHRNQPVP